MVTSLLDGVDDLLDRFISTPRKGQAPWYRHKSNHLGLDASALDGRAMIRAVYERICENWAGAETRVPSRQNWRWCKMLEISDRNTSPEKCLETIARLKGDDWVNQIPTASGVVGSEERQRNIDLGHRIRPGHYDLFELKVGSNTPLHAVVECMAYGVVYLFSRAHRAELGYEGLELIEAETIQVKVLAPSDYYIACNRPGEFCRLVGKIDTGLASLARTLSFDPALDITFSVESFVDPPVRDTAEGVAAVLTSREAVC